MKSQEARKVACRHCEEELIEREDGEWGGRFSRSSICISREGLPAVLHLPMPAGFRGAP
jgi:hypothetical protein